MWRGPERGRKGFSHQLEEPACLTLMLRRQMQLCPVLRTVGIHFPKDFRGIKTKNPLSVIIWVTDWEMRLCSKKNKVKQGRAKWKSDILLRVTAERERDLGDSGRDGRSVHDWDKRQIDGEPGRIPLPHAGIPEIPPTETAKCAAVVLSCKDTWRT